jgi:hypothetical protein
MTEIPAPEVPARPIALADCPGGAQQVWRKAEKEGWTVVGTYAKGPWLYADGTGFKIVESVMLRLFHYPNRVWMTAIWLTDSKGVYGFESAWALFPPQPRYRTSNKALKASLTTLDPPPKIEAPPTEGE